MPKVGADPARPARGTGRGSRRARRPPRRGGQPRSAGDPSAGRRDDSGRQRVLSLAAGDETATVERITGRAPSRLIPVTTSPIENRIGQVFIPVRNMARSARWYATLLGLPEAAPTHN